MKKILVIGVFLLLAFCILPVHAETTPLTLQHNQAQFQWRGIVPFGAWSAIYPVSSEPSDYLLTGKVLHSAWDYSPFVDDQTGAPTVYKYDKKSELWIEKEGQVTYKYPAGYGDYTAVNFFRGYLDFDGETPSDATFEHGVAYQWAYLLAPQTVTPSLQYAIWDNTMDAWLVGFSVYLWDTTSQSYSMSFPDPFIEPVPASNYNPLDL